MESIQANDQQVTLDSKEVKDGAYVVDWSFPEMAKDTSKVFELKYKAKDLVRVNGTDNSFFWYALSDKEAAERVIDIRITTAFLFNVEEQLESVPVFDNVTFNATESITYATWDDYDIVKGNNWTLNVFLPQSVADLGNCLQIDDIRSSEPPMWLAILVLVTILVILAVIIVAIVIAVVSQILHNRAVGRGPSQPSPTHTIDTLDSSTALDASTAAATAVRPTTDVFDPTATPQDVPSSQVV